MLNNLIGLITWLGHKGRISCRQDTSEQFHKAMWYLEWARHLHGDNTESLGFFERYRAEAGLSYEDLGTTAEEIAQLLIDGHKAEAKIWLNLARQGWVNNANRLGYFEEYRQKAGASYEDFGTAAEEIEQLKQVQAA